MSQTGRRLVASWREGNNITSNSQAAFPKEYRNILKPCAWIIVVSFLNDMLFGSLNTVLSFVTSFVVCKISEVSGYSYECSVLDFKLFLVSSFLVWAIFSPYVAFDSQCPLFSLTAEASCVWFVPAFFSFGLLVHIQSFCQHCLGSCQYSGSICSRPSMELLDKISPVLFDSSLCDSGKGKAPGFLSHGVFLKSYLYTARI